MAIKTKAQLHAQSDSTYETNRTGNITAEIVRTFNTDLIDSIFLDANVKSLNVTATGGNITVRLLNLKDLLGFCILYLDVTLRNITSSITVSNANFGVNGIGGFHGARPNGVLKGVYVFVNGYNIEFVKGDDSEMSFTGTVIVVRK